MSKVTKTLHVTGMSCNSCVNHVEKAIGKLGGIEQVTTDLDGEEVTVAYQQDATSLADIEAAVRDAGYEVEPSKETSGSSCCGCCG